MNKLEEIVDKLYESGYNAGDFGGKNTPKKTTTIAQAIAELSVLMNEVLGNKLAEPHPFGDTKSINNYKAIQNQRAHKLGFRED